MEAAYLLNNVEYVVEKATAEDVEVAYEQVQSIVEDTPKDKYVANMERSLTQGYAYKLVASEQIVAWLWLSKTEGIWHGDMFWGKDAIVMSILWRYVNTLTGDIRVRFMPHNGQLGVVKSLATGKSIRLMHNGKPYVVVDTGELQNRCELIHNKLGI